MFHKAQIAQKKYPKGMKIKHIDKKVKRLTNPAFCDMLIWLEKIIYRKEMRRSRPVPRKMASGSVRRD